MVGGTQAIVLSRNDDTAGSRIQAAGLAVSGIRSAFVGMFLLWAASAAAAEPSPFALPPAGVPYTLSDAQGPPNGGNGRLKVDGQSTANQYSLVVRGPYTTAGPEAHTHSHMIEAWYVLEGTVNFQSRNTALVAPAGSFILISPGVDHRFWSEPTQMVKTAQFLAPPGFENFFNERIKLPGYDPARTQAQQSAEWKAAQEGIARKYGAGPSDHASDELPTLVRPDDRWQTDGRREIASWTDTRGHYQLTEWKQSPRRRGKMSSSDTNEGWFVLEGALDFDVGAKHFSAVRGAFVFVPAQTTHRAWNAGPAPARYLAIQSPAAPVKRTLP